MKAMLMIMLAFCTVFVNNFFCNFLDSLASIYRSFAHWKWYLVATTCILTKQQHTKNNTNINFKVTKSFWNFYTLLLFRAQFYFSIYFSEKWVAKTRCCSQNEKVDLQSNALFWLGDFVSSSYRYVYPFVIFNGKFVAEKKEWKTEKDILFKR